VYLCRQQNMAATRVNCRPFSFVNLSLEFLLRFLASCFSRLLFNPQLSVVLHFARVVDDAKCIVVTHVCVSVCVSVCLSAAACPHYYTDPDVTCGSGRGCPSVVHHWADLQSVHGLRCYGNITRTRNVSEYMPVLALCLVVLLSEAT